MGLAELRAPLLRDLQIPFEAREEASRCPTVICLRWRVSMLEREVRSYYVVMLSFIICLMVTYSGYILAEVVILPALKITVVKVQLQLV